VPEEGKVPEGKVRVYPAEAFTVLSVQVHVSVVEVVVHPEFELIEVILLKVSLRIVTVVCESTKCGKNRKKRPKNTFVVLQEKRAKGLMIDELMLMICIDYCRIFSEYDATI
jgi:hypothetical protein